MSRFQLTGDQARATTPDSHIWVDASAGTGKTHVLAARVLRLMAQGAHPGSILCLTYTKAAAGEMTNRILGHLGRWATAHEEGLLAELAVLMGGRSTVTADVAQRARRLFLDVLDLPMGLNVQTLHAFSQSLLGRFPIEARTAPGFETIDSRTAEELLGASRDDLLAAAVTGANAPLSAATQSLARLLADASFNDALKALRAAGNQLLALPQTRTALQTLIEEALELTPGETQPAVLERACTDPQFDAAGLRAVLAAINDHGTATEKTGKGATLATWLAAQPAQRAATFTQYAQLFLTLSGEIRSKLMTKGPEKAMPNGLDIMAQEAQRVLTIQEQCTLITLAQTTADALLFGQHLMGRYNTKKDNAAKLDFDDLIHRTQALLAGADIPTWVMYKLDTQIDHILIDEAQDNSDVQWRIISALTQDFFSLARPERQRSIFAVGDMKQSIYGFQGAKPKLFDDTRYAVKQTATSAGQRFEDVPLDQSFRSVQAVLDVVDTVFQTGGTNALDAARAPMKHSSFRKGIGGQVDLWPIQGPGKQADEDDGWRLPLFERTQTKADRLLAQRIADDIEQRIEAREVLPGRSDPLGAGDFLILVRRRGDFMGHMARALKRRSIALAGIDRFDLKSPLVIRDLINMARFAAMPRDDYTLACVLKGPFCGVSEDALMQLCTQRDGALWDHIRADLNMPKAALDTLRAVLARADYMPPFDFFSQLLLQGGRKALLERLGQEADDAVDVFLEQCLVYERAHVPSLDGFLHWFEQSDVEVQRDAEAAGDKVRIMTIHGAKGLQAPVVYLPDLVGLPKAKYSFMDIEHEAGGKRRNIPIFRRSSSNDVGKVGAATEARKDADYAEYMRLLYVAMTRAEDHLICCGFAAADPKDGERPQRSDRRKDAYDLVSDAFDRLETIEDVADTKRYSCGQTAALPTPSSSAASTVATVPHPAWLNVPAPQEASPPRPLQPSDAGLTAPKLFELDAADDLSPARRGTLIHTLLEHLPDVPASERADAAQRYIQQSAPGISAALEAALIRQSQETLALPALAAVFGPDSRTEVPLVARLGDFVVSGQIDRLAIQEEEVLFVDYKTTASPPTAAQSIAPAYLRQMALYHASLAQMFPGKTIKGALVWTVSGQVNWLDWDALSPHLPASANSAFIDEEMTSS